MNPPVSMRDLDRLAFFPSFEEGISEDSDQALVLCVVWPVVDWARNVELLSGPN